MCKNVSSEVETAALGNGKRPAIALAAGSGATKSTRAQRGPHAGSHPLPEPLAGRPCSGHLHAAPGQPRNGQGCAQLRYRSRGRMPGKCHEHVPTTCPETEGAWGGPGRRRRRLSARLNRPEFPRPPGVPRQWLHGWGGPSCKRPSQGRPRLRPLTCWERSRRDAPRSPGPQAAGCRWDAWPACGHGGHRATCPGGHFAQAPRSAQRHSHGAPR